MTRWAGALAVTTETAGTACLLTAQGVLDSSTYLMLRDAIIKVALDEPSAVLVNVDALDVPADSAWSVFTSARWCVNTWPDVPVALVCAFAHRREIARRNMTRSVSVHPTVDAASNACSATRPPTRQRAAVELPATLSSLRRARRLVDEWLTEWSQLTLIPTASVVANVFVENVLQHTDSAPVLTVESDGVTVAIAVRDGSSAPAARREDPCRGGEPVSGLSIVASLSQNWGSAPTSTGKTVWAVVGPENKL